MDIKPPPLHLFDQGEVVERNDETGHTLRPDVLEWCKNTIGPVYVGSIRVDGGMFELKNDAENTINLTIQIKALRFESECDLIAFKLRWR